MLRGHVAEILQKVLLRIQSYCFGIRLIQKSNKLLYNETRVAQLSGATHYRSSTFGGASTLRQAQTTTPVQIAIETAPTIRARAEGCAGAGVSAASAAR